MAWIDDLTVRWWKIDHIIVQI